ncbi:MAG: amidohydrolase family protein, partial [Verrucomicrobiota bacterium]|nr:amidohydrolase family protein [Verrucomicrobiota bacterium]
MRPLILLFLLLFSARLLAQTPPPASTPAAQIIIHAGSLLDKPGREPRRNATVFIENGKIASIQDGFAKPTAGATLIDLRDRFVLPGLIDCHVHLDSDRAGIEGQLASVTDSAAISAY